VCVCAGVCVCVRVCVRVKICRTCQNSQCVFVIVCVYGVCTCVSVRVYVCVRLCLCLCEDRQNFSKVSSLRNTPCGMTIELTFEKLE